MNTYSYGREFCYLKSRIINEIVKTYVVLDVSFLNSSMTFFERLKSHKESQHIKTPALSVFYFMFHLYSVSLGVHMMLAANFVFMFLKLCNDKTCKNEMLWFWDLIFPSYKLFQSG